MQHDLRYPMPDAGPAPAAGTDRPLRISILLQDALESWYLTRTLETGAHMAGIEVRLGARPEDADLVVVAPSEPGAVTLLQRDALRADVVLVGYSPSEVPGMRWLPRPARTRDARKLLELVQTRRRQAGEGARAPGTLAMPFQVMNFQELLLRLKRGLGNGEPFLVQAALGFSLVMLPRLDKVCMPVDVGVGEVCDSLRQARLADMRSLSEIEAAKRVVETHRHGLSLSALAWEVALQAIPLSATRPLLEGLHLRLRALPDFGVVPETIEHRRWSELLLRRDLALAELVAQSPEGLDAVARFANACSVLGLLEFVAPDAAA